jgi:drug/metabolite transporter (DMT)-like permease
MTNPFKSIIGLSIAFVFLWNSGFIGAEYGLPYTGPFTLLFWRYAALALILFLYLLISKRLKWIGIKYFAHTSLVGILAHGVWLGCVLLALEEKVPAGIVALVVSLQPLVTGVFSGIAVGERTQPIQWIGLVLGFTGVAIAVGSRLTLNSDASTFGYLIPFGSVIAITAASLFQRKVELSGRSEIPIDLTLLYQSLATSVVLFFPALFAEDLVVELTSPFILTMIWLILAVSFGAYAVMWILISRISATKVASLFYLGPPVTMLMAWIAFGDTLKTMDIVGLLVASIGVLLVQFIKEKLPVKAAD